jgi:hypothetical protein
MKQVTMDLLKSMMANRQAMSVVVDPRPSADVRSGKKTSAPKPKTKPMTGNAVPGSKAMRHHIIEEKPGKKVVREHIRALIEKECESSSEEDD